MKLGHPADCNSKKETSQAKKKKGITKIEKEVLQTLDNKNDCLIKIYCQYPNHRWYIKARTQPRSNARSTEFRFEEHHEERVGTNNLSLYPLFLKP